MFVYVCVPFFCVPVLISQLRSFEEDFLFVLRNSVSACGSRSLVLDAWQAFIDSVVGLGLPSVHASLYFSCFGRGAGVHRLVPEAGRLAAGSHR